MHAFAQQTSVASPAPTPAQAPIGAKAPGAPVIPLVQDLQLPQTPRAVRAIRQQREWLSDQLQSASGRREDAAEELAQTTDPVARAGLENRLRVLDERIAQLEIEIATTGFQLTNAPAEAVVGPDVPPWEEMDSGQLTAISIVFTIFVLFPIAISMSRLVWRRASAPRRIKADPADAQRFERLEHAMEAIAIEVERVGEGQRFMTRLLAEANGDLPVGARKKGGDAARLPSTEG